MVMHEGEGPIPGPPAGGPRGLLLTAALQDQIVIHLASGAFYDETAKAVGIGSTTFYIWMQQGRQARDKAEAGRDLEPNEVMYMDFVAAVEQARGRATVHAHATIRAAMPRHWQAAAWYLERTQPRRYARRTWQEEEPPTAEELEAAPEVEAVDEEAEVEAVVTYAERWLAERGRGDPAS
jgi:hypothetical protein